MKKVIFLAIAAAAALTACSKSEVVDSSVMNKAISFESYIGKDAQTKASVVTGVTSVNVNAFLYKLENAENRTFVSNFMTNQAVTRESAEATTWTYTPVRYWPAEDQAIDFVAWVPVADYTVSTGEGESATTETKNNIKVENATLTFNVPSDVTKQSDLIVSDPQPKMNGEVVALHFKHLLSRIGFQINANQLPEDADNKVVLKNVTLNGTFASSGTVDMTAATPAVSATKTGAGEGETQTLAAPTNAYILTGANFGYANDIITNGEKTNNADSYIMLIPDGNAPANINITYEIQTTNGDKTETITNEKVFTLTDPYEAGKAYKYVFEISLDAISFSVEIDEWGNETEVPINPATPEQGA